MLAKLGKANIVLNVLFLYMCVCLSAKKQLLIINGYMRTVQQIDYTLLANVNLPTRSL